MGFNFRTEGTKGLIAKTHLTSMLTVYRIIPTLLAIMAMDFPASLPKNKPMFFEMRKEHEQIAEVQPIFEFRGKDTTTTHQLISLSDNEKKPLLYYADIQTPVCIDNICKPVFIEIYWNLLGNYVGFGVFEDHLLTKYDHDLFEPADYQLLHDLLLDKHSILGRRELKSLFDPSVKPEKEIEYKGQKVDGVSGATRKEIKESVVAGGLFSCYTMWHLVNGEVTVKMADRLDSVLSYELINYFLYSDYVDYQFYALKKMSGEDMYSEFHRIMEIYPQVNGLTKTYILKKLPLTVWQDQDHARRLYRLFSVSDINSKTVLVDKLDVAHGDGCSILAGQVEGMTKNHLKEYLSVLEEKEGMVVTEITQILSEVATQDEYRYAYLITDFLDRNIDE